jgi:hypothetical protein
MEKDLQLDDFTMQEVDEYFRSCAVDPGVNTLVTAAYGHGNERHQLRRFSNSEYYAVTGSSRRNDQLNKKKESHGIKAIEDKFPTAKTADHREYERYIQYLFDNLVSLLSFYGPERAEESFQGYQGRQRALEEVTNVLINGGKKYDRRRRKKTKRNRKSRHTNRWQKKVKKKIDDSRSLHV